MIAETKELIAAADSLLKRLEAFHGSGKGKVMTEIQHVRTAKAGLAARLAYYQGAAKKAPKAAAAKAAATPALAAAGYATGRADGATER
jgi:hypothetical protein